MGNPGKYWFALHTKVNQEFKTAEQLTKISIEYYLPTVTKIKQWSDRKKKITESIIKGYIFIYANEIQRLEALTIPSVVRCISENGKPTKIPAWQIENLKNVIENKMDFIIHNGLIEGQIVQITDGPLKGLKGVIQRTNQSKHLCLNLDLLNRSVIVKMSDRISVKIVEVN